MRPQSVELREITKRFGSVVALDDMSLKIKAGGFPTLLGPSGYGKSALVNSDLVCLARLQMRPTIGVGWKRKKM